MSLVEKRLALPVSLGLGGSVLRPLLTSVRHESGCPVRPAFRASSTRGYAAQISPNKNVNFRRASSPSTTESAGNGFAVSGQLTSESL